MGGEKGGVQETTRPVSQYHQAQPPKEKQKKQKKNPKAPTKPTKKGGGGGGKGKGGGGGKVVPRKALNGVYGVGRRSHGERGGGGGGGLGGGWPKGRTQAHPEAKSKAEWKSLGGARDF